MIRDTIRKLEARIRDAGGASAEMRDELLGLLADLREELESLEETRADDARALAGRAWTAASGAARDEAGVIEEIEGSVKEFELSHPRLAAALRSFFRTLADAGI